MLNLPLQQKDTLNCRFQAVNTNGFKCVGILFRFLMYNLVFPLFLSCHVSVQGTHLSGIKAGEWGAKDLQIVASSPQGIVHVVVVGVGMVAMPI